MSAPISLLAALLQTSQPTSEVDVQGVINGLISLGETPETIASRMDHRVSARTIYRWAKGEHNPQQRADINVLIQVAQTVMREKAETSEASA